jgi:hypothetical protein
MASKESSPEGPVSGLPLKGAVLVKALQVKSVESGLKCLKLWSRFAPPILCN